MEIRKNNKQNINKKLVNKTSVLLGVDASGIEVETARIKTLCAKFAEIAFSLGETNDPEEYAEEMEESILEAYEKVSKKKRLKRGN